MPGPRVRSTAAAIRASSGWWLLAAAVSAAAIVLRVRGIAQLPLADDEYYIVRSVQNILTRGEPEYACGGYYPRGLLFQYLSAGLALGGVSLEFAPRYLAAVSSLLVLPGAFLVARRVGGTTVALSVLAWLLLSAWQIDGAQFGRMYAPFQAIFVWYSLYFLRATVDHDLRARIPLTALSIAGILTWEGGIFLALTNLLVPFLETRERRFEARDWLFVGLAAALAAGAYLLITGDFRGLNSSLVYPAGFASVETVATPGWREVAAMMGPIGQRQWPWLVAGVLPLAVSVLAVRRLWKPGRVHWMTTAALGLALVAAAVHQFGASLLVIALAMTLGLVRIRDLASRPARIYVAAWVLWLAGWLIYGLFGAAWTEGSDTSVISRIPLLTLLYNLARFPDFLFEIVIPWTRAAPRLALAIGLACAVTILRAGLRPGTMTPAMRLALFLFLLLLGAAAASDPPRHETRYVYFLYPLGITILLATVGQLVASALPARRPAALASTLVAALLFLCTEDTGARAPRDSTRAHPLHPAILPPAGASHFVGRADNRAVADWLRMYARPAQDLIINASPGVDFYYADFDFAYIDWTHQRFRAYSCDQGRRERWGNLRLIYRREALDQMLALRDRALIVTPPALAATLRETWPPNLATRLAYQTADDALVVLEVRKVSRP